MRPGFLADAELGIETRREAFTPTRRLNIGKLG